MAKEIIIRLGPAVTPAFYEALKGNENLQNLNPDVATRWAIDKQLHTA